jgi:hypothetical protein
MWVRGMITTSGRAAFGRQKVQSRETSAQHKRCVKNWRELLAHRGESPRRGRFAYWRRCLRSCSRTKFDFRRENGLVVDSADDWMSLLIARFNG